MVKRTLFWQSPVLAAVIFVLMTCAALAAESPDNDELAPHFVAKLYKSWKSVYFYDCWRNSGNSMAIVDTFSHRPLLTDWQLAVLSFPSPAHQARISDALSLRALSLNNLSSTG